MVDCVLQDECNSALPIALLRDTSIPLIALHGSADVHSFISSNMPMIRAAAFDAFPTTVSQKPKKANYDGIRANGILKERWLQKHVLETPSVIAYLVEVTDVQGNFTLEGALQYVAELKRKERAKNIRFAVLAVIRGQAGDDLDSILYSFRARAEIDPRNFAGLVLTGASAPRRAERAQLMLIELAHLFYEDDAKRSRWVCESLSRATQTDLIVRHSFKIAFNLEHEKDKAPSLRQYIATYGELWDFVYAGGTYPHVKSRHEELKAVAELVNYKICRLLLMSGNYKDAYAQLRRHVVIYQQVRGRDDLIFAHYGWLARQHMHFALLCMEHNATRASKSPLGFAVGELAEVEVGEHLEAAAHWFARRKAAAAAALSAFNPAADAAAAGDAAGRQLAMFWGQPRRAAGVSGEGGVAVVVQTDADAAARRVAERGVAHGPCVLTLLEAAAGHYAAAGQGRRAVHVRVVEGAELVCAGRFADARAWLEWAWARLAQEGWSVLSGECLWLLSEACRGLADAAAWLPHAVRLLTGPNRGTAQDRRVFLQAHLSALVTGQAPAVSGPPGPAGPSVAWPAGAGPLRVPGDVWGAGAGAGEEGRGPVVVGCGLVAGAGRVAEGLEVRVGLWLAAHPGLLSGPLRVTRIRVAMSVAGLSRTVAFPPPGGAAGEGDVAGDVADLDPAQCPWPDSEVPPASAPGEAGGAVLGAGRVLRVAAALLRAEDPGWAAVARDVARAAADGGGGAGAELRVERVEVECGDGPGPGLLWDVAPAASPAHVALAASARKVGAGRGGTAPEWADGGWHGAARVVLRAEAAAAAQARVAVQLVDAGRAEAGTAGAVNSGDGGDGGDVLGLVLGAWHPLRVSLGDGASPGDAPSPDSRSSPDPGGPGGGGDGELRVALSGRAATGGADGGADGVQVLVGQRAGPDGGAWRQAVAGPDGSADIQAPSPPAGAVGGWGPGRSVTVWVRVQRAGGGPGGGGAGVVGALAVEVRRRGAGGEWQAAGGCAARFAARAAWTLTALCAPAPPLLGPHKHGLGGGGGGGRAVEARWGSGEGTAEEALDAIARGAAQGGDGGGDGGGGGGGGGGGSGGGDGVGGDPGGSCCGTGLLAAAAAAAAKGVREGSGTLVQAVLQGTGAGPVAVLSAAFRAHAAPPHRPDSVPWVDLAGAGRLPQRLSGPDDALRLALVLPPQPGPARGLAAGHVRAGPAHVGAGVLRIRWAHALAGRPGRDGAEGGAEGDVFSEDVVSEDLLPVGGTAVPAGGPRGARGAGEKDAGGPGIYMEAPRVGRQGEAVRVTLVIENRSHAVEEVTVEALGVSEHFLVAGFRVGSAAVSPWDLLRVPLVLVPVAPGHVPLPTLRVRCRRDPRPAAPGATQPGPGGDTGREAPRCFMTVLPRLA